MVLDLLFPRDDVGEKKGPSLEDFVLEAVKAGNVAKVETLLKRGANINEKDDKGLTPLHHACWNGDVEMARVLLKHGGSALLQAKSGYGSTPLHCAADKGHTSTVLMLLQAGANSNAKNSGGLTPLHYTAWNDHLDTARVLLDNGADKEAKTVEGCTPLHLASKYGKVGVAVLLVDRGADPYATNMRHETSFDVAKNSATASVLRVRVIDLDKRSNSPIERQAMMNSLIHENNKLQVDYMKHMDNDQKIAQLHQELVQWKEREPGRKKEEAEIRAAFNICKQKDDVMDAMMDALQNKIHQYKRLEIEHQLQIQQMEDQLAGKAVTGGGNAMRGVNSGVSSSFFSEHLANFGRMCSA